MTFFIIDFSEF